MRVVLQPKICMREGYRDVRPQSSETFAFAHMRHCSQVFSELPLRHVHWIIGPSGDGIDDVDHAAEGGVTCSLWGLP